uniref:isoleucine--tRNA ligase n=3 Tax=Rhodosorus marinus TaxID=101924 RepID=A0A7S3EEK2_9RHOD|mmetsp:Transcript_30587/g.116977  ORF Transcript_30587/g.116977 Transcript_30587/m.116977 type:complete len:843 (+) Transcript_30587:80-2608(+)
MDPMSSCLGFTSAGVPRMLRGGPLVNRQCSNRLIPRHGIVMGARKEKKEDANSGFYKNTVNLPSTNFSQRANAVKTEPEIQKFWADSKTYEKLSSENPREVYSLHDGPPYANGDIHMGHALNKVLKDFINRYQLLQGKKATLIPGWDCHGLPIELKVLQSLKSKERKDLTPSALRKKAKEFALKTIESQKASFQRLGVWASWDTPYLTLNPEYEAAQIEVFGKMFLEGYIYRGKKPVHWSPSSRTALAEAELEYPDEHISRSIYAAFSIVDADKSKNELVKKHSDALSVAVWTTTPWTLPANRAVAVNPAIVYALVELEGRVLIVAKDLVEAVGHKLEKDLVVIGEVTGNDLAGLHYEHPIQDGLKCKILIGGDYITTESGTGLVHTAPGHGQEDYIVGMREGLEIFSPVDNAGRFTDEFCEGSFAGLSVLDEGNQAIIDHVSKRDVLLLEEKYNHKYPYDWRTKKPTIFRATEQWFASVEGFRDQALEAVRGVQWTPEAGEKRIFNMIEGRNDWCISRQRTWGVPIPVFYDGDGEPVLNQQIISRVAELFREHGSDIWWELEAEDLLPEQYRGEGLQKGMDTMDVWFDSGSSWNAVTKQSPEMTFPADVYLEGSDQHRGWFQSSLLTSVATEGQAPYKKVLTHGFVLDQNGLKMSKSVGNVVDPLKLVNGGNNQKTEPAYGADVLRLWVSSVDYSGDVLVGPEIIKTVSDSYRKIRNTLRYIVSNVNDYDPRTGMSFDELPVLDKYMLRRLATIAEDMEAAYETSSFVRLYQGLMRFATVDLSNFYLDIAKDRLYISGTDDYRRRSCQKVLYHLLEILTRSIAPILPHTAEDLWRYVPPWR